MAIHRIWVEIQDYAKQVSSSEKYLKNFLNTNVLSHSSATKSLAHILAAKLCDNNICREDMLSILDKAYNNIPDIENSLYTDITTFAENDPAINDMLVPFIFFKGFHALQTHRAAHYYWNNNQKYTALLLQSRSSEVFGTDIHPAAKIGKGIMIDHATGLVVGETAIIEDHVLIWHNVTLGGKGLVKGNRHPIIRKDALVGTGSVILGRIEIGAGAKVGAGSVVTEDVASGATVVGDAARVIKKTVQ